MGIFSKLKQAWFGDVNWEKLDDSFFDGLEEALILGDVGVNIATDAVNSLRNVVFSYDMKDPEQVKAELRKILLQKLSVGDTELDTSKSPTVILVIGVNGVGKTTSIGKLAVRLRNQGKKVLLCAGDTFRAAAVVAHEHGAANHDRVCAEGNGFEDIVAGAYSAVDNDLGLAADSLDYLRQHLRRCGRTREHPAAVV